MLWQICAGLSLRALFFFLFEVKKIPHMHFYVSINLLLVSWESHACKQEEEEEKEDSTWVDV